MILKLKQTPGIYLVGFMGSGKSTLGHLLAKHIGWPFADLDRDIETAHQSTIPDLFETLGEPGFRKIESEALITRTRAVKNGRPIVLALGGGTYVQQANVELIEASGISIWLDTPFEAIEERVSRSSHRPLAADPVFFRELYVSRREAYSKAAYSIRTTAEDPAVNLDRLLQLPIFDK